MCKRIKERLIDRIIDKQQRQKITAWGTFTDYIFVLEHFGELEVGRSNYCSYNIGEMFEFTIKRRAR